MTEQPNNPPFLDYREESKKNWGSKQHGKLDREQIMLGAILRIADATEKMAKNYDQMQRDLDWHKRQSNLKSDHINTLNKSRSAYMGHNKKLRDENKKLRAERSKHVK